MRRTVKWKLHLKSDPKVVFDLLSTSEGREKFWAEKATENNGVIRFSFPNGQAYNGQILKTIRNRKFHLDYFNSLVTFDLEPSKNGGTDLTLINKNVHESEFSEVKAGWISVLMNLKAVADFKCDLRNHDPKRTWDQGYADN
ncbi:SRPBCC family protein [Aquimarina mytili]|uniref:SRPBCC domain-containing protein n=1 Tax=Aquimarina mytili TaxID=874423 RepID=A0A937A199_9FLAO|nr:SRPBCC domain-containing protein [Aquimarina mytili]MBL0686166.1 SRPBCC domain-containing protein [Aquimarina mytili]